MKAGVSIQRFETMVYPDIGLIYEIYIDKYLNEEDFNKLYSYLVSKYNYFPVQIHNTEPVVKLIPIIRKKTSHMMKTLLLVITSLTVLLTGFGLSESFYNVLNIKNTQLIILWSIVYSTIFLLALGLHEYGHLKTSHRENIVVDGPFFIPAPPIQLGFIGTLGAVITMRTIPPNRESLAKLGLSGPAISFTIGLLIGLIGIYLSPHVPVNQVRELSEVVFLPLALQLMLFFIKLEEGFVILAHPLLIASFIILLVTFLNLLPIGQLDGGHVIRSYVSSEFYEKISYFVILASLVASIVLNLLNKQAYMYYTSLTIILVLFKILFGRKPHPGSANQLSKIRKYRYLFIYLLLIILTIPIPI